ncbi:FtsX-like permease family protein [Phytohabitans sp. ZYX-F-186]|uniref:FtsX-like permease family protein n=1 Tax=Phytohabitans maris TaxID=3071409 RepID=A0ABU0Z7G1_9ACTN|nr:FtsX-like permease family protein [Phytohabitans sp. ZYX-F-186]MDQ7902996.1 FtsX-like permease family protein [Phytohabitans sp. ZYX-F-186]
MSATLRLALSGLRGRSKVAAGATALVAALAAAAVVAGLSVQSQGGPQVDEIYRDSGRPDLVVYGEPAALAGLRGDAAFAATGPVTPFTTGDVEIGDGSVEARVATLPPASAVGAPQLRTGRWPVAAGEVVFDRATAVEAGVRDGDLVRVDVAGRPSTLTVVGTAVDLTDCFYPDCDPIRLFVSPAGLDALAPSGVERGALLIGRLTDPDAADAAAARLGTLPGVDGVQPWPDTRDDILVRELIFGASLAGFGVFVLLAAAFVVAGAAAARLLARRREIAMLQAVGYTNRQVVGGLLGETLLLGVTGAVLGWVVGTLVAPLLQVGLAAAMGRTGLRVSVVSLLIAVAFVGVILAAATVIPARRAARQPVTDVLRDAPPRSAAPARVARLLERLRLAPAARFGLGTVLARPARSALTAAALAIAVAAVVVAAGFMSTMDRIVSEPARAGDPYDVMVAGDGTGGAGTAAALSAMPEVAGWYTQTDRRATLGEETFLARAIGGDPAQAGFLLREGEPLRAAGEAVAGYGFLRRFGLAVGDTVDIRAGEAALSLRIVGWYSETEDTGEVLMYRAEMLPGATPDAFLVSGRGGSPEALATALRDRLGPAATVRAREADPDELGVFTVALQVMAGLVLVVSLANLAAALLSGARERARVLGVLRTVGFTVRQTLAQSATGGAALGLAAGIVGLPVGLVVLRVLADQVTTGIGAGPGLSQYPSGLLLAATVPAAALAGALAGAAATRRLAGTSAATLVRWE